MNSSDIRPCRHHDLRDKRQTFLPSPDVDLPTSFSRPQGRGQISSQDSTLPSSHAADLWHLSGATRLDSPSHTAQGCSHVGSRETGPPGHGGWQDTFLGPSGCEGLLPKPTASPPAVLSNTRSAFLFLSECTCIPRKPNLPGSVDLRERNHHKILKLAPGDDSP